MAATVTIRTTDDILYALDTHPEWLAAVRAKILTQEIMDLPHKVAQLSDTVAQLSDTVAQLVRAVDVIQKDVGTLKERVGRLEEGQKRLEEGQKRLEEGQKQLEEGQKQLGEGQKQLGEGQKQLETRVVSVGKRVASIDDGLRGRNLERWATHAGRDWFRRYLTGLYPGLRLQRKMYTDTPAKGAQSLSVFQQAMLPEEDLDGFENPAYTDCIWEFILRSGAPCGLNKVWALCEVSYRVDSDDIARAAARGQVLSRQLAADERMIPCVLGPVWKDPEAVRALADQTRVLLLEATLKVDKDLELDVSLDIGIAALNPIHATDRFIRSRLEEGRAA